MNRNTDKKINIKREHSLLILFLILCLSVLPLAGCGRDGGNDSGSANSLNRDNSADSSATVSIAGSIVSTEDFKAAASHYGTVADLTDQLSYEAAVVTDSDRFNIIFMDLPTPEQAERMIYEQDENGSGKNPYVTLLSADTDPVIYEENCPADESLGFEAYYGYYLRSGSMLLIVTGAPEDKEDITAAAENIFANLMLQAETE